MSEASVDVDELNLRIFLSLGNYQFEIAVPTTAQNLPGVQALADLLRRELDLPEVEPSLVDELIAERRDAAAQEDEPIRYVAIGVGERAPWATLPLTCPTCGAGPLPLEESTGGDEAGIKLRFIAHCGGVWLRGDIDQ